MNEQLTKIDFSNHELIIEKSHNLSVHYLKKPNTYYDSIKYINTNGILAVTGDYSNWIFCREFHPGITDHDLAQSGYWKEKLKIASCQEPAHFDPDRTEEAIKKLLNDPNEKLSEESIEWLNELLELVHDEYEYIYKAYRETPDGWDYEYIPFVKSVSYHFLAILDGFNEICRRLKEAEEIKSTILSEATLPRALHLKSLQQSVFGKGVYLKDELIGYVTKHIQNTDIDTVVCLLKMNLAHRFDMIEIDASSIFDSDLEFKTLSIK